MDVDEKRYLLTRAEDEIELANRARHERAAQAQHYLAAFYLGTPAETAQG